MPEDPLNGEAIAHPARVSSRRLNVEQPIAKRSSLRGGGKSGRGRLSAGQSVDRLRSRRLHLKPITATLGAMSASSGWPPRPRIVALSAALLALTLRTATFADVACEDIAKVDLANSVLPIPGEGARAFSNGVACWDYDGGPGCEWRSEIHLDLLTTPESGTSLRVLKIFESHMRGSGSWARMIGYRCERGRLVATFSE
jgi:hypothetical protein